MATAKAQVRNSLGALWRRGGDIELWRWTWRLAAYARYHCSGAPDAFTDLRRAALPWSVMLSCALRVDRESSGSLRSNLPSSITKRTSRKGLKARRKVMGGVTTVARIGSGLADGWSSENVVAMSERSTYSPAEPAFCLSDLEWGGGRHMNGAPFDRRRDDQNSIPETRP
ncbi:hypothetical protein J2D73_00275 [Acetobacter sacchari]|uniref:Uncharacterized protein n=1 Tax=Acetobacter sacchari TaxID=2661687 RepID=A0ABS3LQP6_9PROT|nr:hypothetical protein [Acetobacter sacchari]